MDEPVSTFAWATWHMSGGVWLSMSLHFTFFGMRVFWSWCRW